MITLSGMSIAGLTQIEGTVTSNAKAEKLKLLMQLFIGPRCRPNLNVSVNTEFGGIVYLTIVSLRQIRQRRR